MPFGLGFWANQARATVADYQLLETVVLSSSQASVEFTNLATKYAADYQHLQVRMVARTNSTFLTRDGAKIRYNGGTQTDYSYHLLLGNGSNVVSFADAAATYFYVPVDSFPNANVSANIFGAAVIDILDPFETGKNTVTRTLSGQAASTNAIALSSSGWFYTDSLTSIKIEPDVGSSWVQHTRISLYGLR
jgi:hypothetical protein